MCLTKIALLAFLNDLYQWHNKSHAQKLAIKINHNGHTFWAQIWGGLRYDVTQELKKKENDFNF